MNKELYKAVLANVTTLEEYMTGIEDLYRTEINTTYNTELLTLDRMVWHVQSRIEELRNHIEGMLSA